MKKTPGFEMQGGKSNGGSKNELGNPGRQCVQSDGSIPRVRAEQVHLTSFKQADLLIISLP